VTSRLAQDAYDIFKNKDDNCIKVVLKPDWNGDEVIH